MEGGEAHTFTITTTESNSTKAINGFCAECGYRLAWIVIHGRSVIPDFKYQRHLSPAPD
jgi:hypothetical protein